jgi:hypothetical protein
MSLPEYPKDDDGQKDHEAAICLMFNHLPLRSRPVHADVDSRIMTFVGTSDDHSTMQYHLEENYADTGRREIDTEFLWHDFVHGSLMPVRVEYLAPDEDVYNLEEHGKFAEFVDGVENYPL